MILRLRLVDRKTGEVVKCEKIAFHDGKPHIINEWVAKNYEIQVLKTVEPWEGTFKAYASPGEYVGGNPTAPPASWEPVASEQAEAIKVATARSYSVWVPVTLDFET